MYIKTPRLPEKRAVCVIIGEAYADLLTEPLRSLGLQVLTLTSPDGFPDSIAGHADLRVCHLGGKKIMLAKGEYLLNEVLIGLGFEVIFSSGKITAGYPGETALNILQIGRIVLHNTKHTDKVLKQVLNNIGTRLLQVNQGYTGCSTLVIGEKAAITADRSIFEILQSEGIDTLLISPGGIDLPGYDYGFIGGSGGMLSPHEVIFTGKLDLHPDRVRILGFLQNHEVYPIYLTERPCFDIGGIIPVLQE